MSARSLLVTSRRTFLRVSAGTTGGLVLALVLPGSRVLAAGSSPLTPNAFIRIQRDGRVTMVMHKIEMGQGLYTVMPMLLAEELEVSLDHVDLEHAPPDDGRYGDALLGGVQITGGSTAMRSSWVPLRQAGATARVLLINAAASVWKVEPTTLSARDGSVFENGTNRRIGFGELVDIAATLPMPGKVDLKPASQFRIIGKRVHRLDGRSKTDGTAQFGIDTRLPGMRFATVAASPVFGGTLATVDTAAALRVAGVRQVVKLDDAVAIVGDHMWAAKQGLAAAKPTWNEGPHAHLDLDKVIAQLKADSVKPGAVAKKVGDANSSFAAAQTRLEATYQSPFLAHATMEPINCTVQVRNGQVDIWVGTQVPTIAQATAAKVAGVPVPNVKVHNNLLGGGFGRRLEVDFIAQAVLIAKQVDGPVKVVWTREEDIQHDMYRPYFYDQMSAGLGSDGMPTSWRQRIAGSSIMARFFPSFFQNGVDPDTIDCAAETPYSIAAVLVDYVRVEPPGIRTAFWRGVGATHNGFPVEGFIDELAVAAKQDPLVYRRKLIHDQRLLAVLNLAAEKAGWGNPLPLGQGRGIAVLHAFGSYVAQVAQVEVANGEVKVLRVTCAIDCGLPVNSDTIAAQMEGGIVFGLSAALWGEIKIANGRVQQSNFHDYRVMRMSETPAIDVHIVASSEAPSGVGEPGTSVSIPALVNAVYAATGRRIRTLPIGDQLAA